ncbi:MAG TPA: hypothetical protein VNT26_08120 [Candidatus Sulfotelmatobacter sp.]|nr:hypothetical protein [Candidatus Sulfotelmatobacter sp.]
MVVALAGLWAMMLLPAVARTQPNTKAIQCQYNLKRLTAAWTMYASDYRSTLVPNNFSGAAAGGADTNNWVTGWLDWTSRPDNTNTAFLAQEHYARLAPYFNSTPTFFKCPSDNYKSPPFLASRVRSISMNAAVGQGTGKTSYIPTLFVAAKLSDFVNPSPACAWVLTDEQADSINDGCLINDPGVSPGSYAWTDLPASYHNGGGSFSFADGHTEIKKWLDPRTRAPVRLTAYQIFSCPGSVDYAWLVAHTPRRP